MKKMSQMGNLVQIQVTLQNELKPPLSSLFLKNLDHIVEGFLDANVIPERSPELVRSCPKVPENPRSVQRSKLVSLKTLAMFLYFHLSTCPKS